MTPNVASLKEKLTKELTKITEDYCYYAENYAMTLDETQGKKVKFLLFDQQKEYMKNLMSHRFNIVPKSRQSGISTTTALFCALHMMFNKDRKICIVAHKKDGAENFMKKIQEFLHDRPKWLGDDGKKAGIYIVSESLKRIKLSNGSECECFASSSNSLRSYTPTLLILDECAFIPNASVLWTAASATLSTGGRAIFISTPNGMDELFFKTYQQSLDKKSEFHITYIRWWRDKRYNRDLKWVKGEDVVFEQEDEKRMMELYMANYIPTSPWFESQRALLNYDERRIAQEYQIEFLGSSQTVVPINILNEAEKKLIEPIGHHHKFTDILYYKEPEPTRMYLCGADVSSGTSSDYSAAIVIDVQTFEIMADYKGKVSPDEFGRVLYELCLPYNEAMIVLDISGGMGISTIVELMQNLKYKNIYHSTSKKKTIQDRLNMLSNQPQNDKVPGITITGGNRGNIVEEFAAAVRKEDLEITSRRLLAELKTFVYKDNGKAEHMTGANDDLIFALCLAIYVINYDQRNIQKGTETTKFLLSVMVRANSTVGKVARGKYAEFLEDKKDKKVIGSFYIPKNTGTKSFDSKKGFLF